MVETSPFSAYIHKKEELSRSPNTRSKVKLPAIAVPAESRRTRNMMFPNWDFKSRKSSYENNMNNNSHLESCEKVVDPRVNS